MGLSNELSKFIPKDFGKKKKGKEKGKKGEVKECKKQEQEEEKVPAAVEEPRETTVEYTDCLPITHRLDLISHAHPVGSLAWDPQGDRLATGDLQGNLSLWDFASMTTPQPSPFRTLVPATDGNHQQIRHLQYNRQGTHLLCLLSDPRPRVLDPEGRRLKEFKGGDMYVSDMRNTRGHVGEVMCGGWDPLANGRFVTGGRDGTLRLWGMEGGQARVVVASRKKAAVTACCFGERRIAGGLADGGLGVWDTMGGKYSRPVWHAENSEMAETTNVRLVGENNLLTRGEGTVRLWDMRNGRAPVAQREGLAGVGGLRGEGMAMDPSGQRVLLATENALVVLSIEDLAVVRRSPMFEKNNRPADVLWHPKLNQLAVSSTSGPIAICYDPQTSRRGALLCVHRRNPKHQTSQSAGPIITPHALPLFREPTGRKRKQLTVPQEPPRMAHGRGGTIGVNETQHIMKSLIKDTMRDEDPREALLKYAEVAEADPRFVAPAYQGNRQVFDQATDDVPELKRRK